jgi:NADP-dependent aldehyde dehydrogenase
MPGSGAADVATATAAAAEAFAEYRRWPAARRAVLLRGIADGLEALGDELVAVADAETGLGETRLSGEVGRTCGQLRAFADLVTAGWHVEAMIDTAGPDLRRMLVPLGPVAVFGASNFPLAFSVPGGDTASALAAGCPVVVKAHPSHPRTSALCARAITAALADAGAPAGVFGLVEGASNAVGEALVTAPAITAVGFTGSLAGGRALYDLAAARPQPIPVYAEMGSLNPVFVTAGALAARGQAIAEGFVGSMTMGTGQFCTKPGLVFVPAGAAQGFVDAVAEGLAGVEGGPLLNDRIRDTLAGQLEATTALPGVQAVVRGSAGDVCTPTLLRVDWETYAATPALAEEHFGPVSVVVAVPDDGFAEAAGTLAGSLTATVHAEPAEHDAVAALLEVLREKAGRLVWNGFPTGVAVTHAMQHGGPYPATTNPLHTSVGSTSIRRFLRPVAYQDTPAALLPDELRDENPLGILRLVNGRWTPAPVQG